MEINKDLYKRKLKELIEEKFDFNLSDQNIKSVEYEVAEPMLGYMLQEYGKYYHGNIIGLLLVHRRLLSICLEELKNE